MSASSVGRGEDIEEKDIQRNYDHGEDPSEDTAEEAAEEENKQYSFINTIRQVYAVHTSRKDAGC